MTLSAEVSYVPDGDPCPKDGLKTRLTLIPCAGFVSQCVLCDDAFLAWYSGHTRDVVRSEPAPPPAPPAPAQMALL